MEQSHDHDGAVLKALLAPDAVAVIGASDRLRYGGRVLQNLREGGFKGGIYPVNPHGGLIQGLKAYEDVRDVPDRVDLAVIAVPAESLLSVIEGCGQKGIKAAAIITAGFAERGGDGDARQRALIEAAFRSGVHFTGPNSLGVVNTGHRLMCHGALPWAVVRPVPGRLSIISQSGALAFTSLLNRAAQAGVGVNKVVSVGNQADLSVLDLAEYLIEHDDETRVVCLYLEGLPRRSGERLVALGRRALDVEKSVIVLKVGASDQGKHAAAAHTGALAGNDVAYAAAMRQGGIVRVGDLDDLWESGSLLASVPHLELHDGIAVMSNSGGLTTHFVDLCGLAGLPVAPVTEQTRHAIELKLDGRGSAGNPADISGQVMKTDADGVTHGNESVKDYLKYMSEDPGVELTVLGITTPSSGPASVEVAHHVEEAQESSKKPIVVLWPAATMVDGLPSGDSAGYWQLRSSGVAVFDQPARCVRALTLLRERERNRRIHLTRRQKATFGSSSPLIWPLQIGEEFEVAKAAGISAPEIEFVSDVQSARAAAGRLGFPVVMKVYSSAMPHKSEGGGVRGPLRDLATLEMAYEEMDSTAVRLRAPFRIGVQEFVDSEATEMIISTYRDDTFGVVTLVGVGGVLVEVLRDTSARVGAVSDDAAADMVSRLRGARLLTGFRGQPARDVTALYTAISRLSTVLVSPGYHAVDLIEINPLMVLTAGRGVRAVDVRVLAGHP